MREKKEEERRERTSKIKKNKYIEQKSKFKALELVHRHTSVVRLSKFLESSFDCRQVNSPVPCFHYKELFAPFCIKSNMLNPHFC